MHAASTAAWRREARTGPQVPLRLGRRLCLPCPSAHMPRAGDGVMSAAINGSHSRWCIMHHDGITGAVYCCIHVWRPIGGRLQRIVLAGASFYSNRLHLDPAMAHECLPQYRKPMLFCVPCLRLSCGAAAGRCAVDLLRAAFPIAGVVGGPSLASCSSAGERLGPVGASEN